MNLEFIWIELVVSSYEWIGFNEIVFASICEHVFDI